MGIEPTRPKSLDFESSASTNSATWASYLESRKYRNFSLPIPDFQYFSLFLASTLLLEFLMYFKTIILLVVHFDEIRQFEWILRLKMSEICIENKNFNTNLDLDTIFRTSKSLELTVKGIFRFKSTTGYNIISLILLKIVTYIL